MIKMLDFFNELNDECILMDWNEEITHMWCANPTMTILLQWSIRPSAKSICSVHGGAAIPSTSFTKVMKNMSTSFEGNIKFKDEEVLICSTQKSKTVSMFTEISVKLMDTLSDRLQVEPAAEHKLVSFDLETLKNQLEIMTILVGELVSIEVKKEQDSTFIEFSCDGLRGSQKVELPIRLIKDTTVKDEDKEEEIPLVDIKLLKTALKHITKINPTGVQLYITDKYLLFKLSTSNPEGQVDVVVSLRLP